MDTIK